MSKKGKQRCTEVKTEDRNKYIPALDSIEAAISRGNEPTTAEQQQQSRAVGTANCIREGRQEQPAINKATLKQPSGAAGIVSYAPSFAQNKLTIVNGMTKAIASHIRRIVRKIRINIIAHGQRERETEDDLPRNLPRRSPSLTSWYEGTVMTDDDEEERRREIGDEFRRGEAQWAD
ncbi:hypothetical protein SAY86_021751 [Trapa natans]|uniref:Uncharacterized protein n=1 Tax=Trapa natans TaxID=22666 RepID=A0AAN7M979_TRANT|nr:hypothetical protein SAY86_021751 [Trapa natans]